ncbi:MAG: hypothetical protein IH594_15370 [Bacteroidales bacterium]|nr:hypothetical protein [Bacteroidales bacterium]
MKINQIIPLLLILISYSCTTNNSSLKEEFLNPPLAFRMNHNIHNFPLDPEGQDSLINKYLETGYGGFAMNVPFNHYLTDEGMKATLEFCEKAKAKGMELWLYDEKGYPSGNAGDLVIKANPDWEGMGLYCKDTLVQKGKLSYKIPPGTPEMIAAYPVINKVPDFTQKTDLGKFIDGSKLNWNAPEGDWLIMAITKYRLYESFQASHKGGSKMGSNYPSLMIPEVTEKFIEVTHEAYARYMGEDLGKYFIATFTDEPSLMAVPFPWEEWSVIPWHGILSDQIEANYGYRPEEKLEILFRDKGPEGQKLRYQYFKTVTELITNNFFKPIKEWCEQHNFLSGGHLLLEETMMAHVPLYGDIMSCFREMHAPGIDILSCRPVRMPVHSPKLASSAAELTGNTLIMSEPCPVADRAVMDGKEPPASEVRGHLNMLMLGGVTDFNNYLQLSNSDNQEKEEFNIYVGRIARMLRGGNTVPDIGIVYPIESLWTRFIPEPQKVAGWDSVAGGAKDAILVEQTFRNISRYVFTNRWEYTYLDSKALIDSKVMENELVHGPLTWDIIILPAVSTLPAKAWERLEEYISSGGKLIALEFLPENSDTGFPDDEVKNRFKELFKSSENVVFIKDWQAADIEEILGKWGKRAVAIEDKTLPLRLAHKKINGSDVFFIANDSPQSIETTIEFSTKKSMEEWDPATGEVTKIENTQLIALNPYHGKIYRTVK